MKPMHARWLNQVSLISSSFQRLFTSIIKLFFFKPATHGSMWPSARHSPFFLSLTQSPPPLSPSSSFSPLSLHSAMQLCWTFEASFVLFSLSLFQWQRPSRRQRQRYEDDNTDLVEQKLQSDTFLCTFNVQNNEQ